MANMYCSCCSVLKISNNVSVNNLFAVLNNNLNTRFPSPSDYPYTDSWHFVLFRKASQQLEKSTDLCPHVPPGGPPALRGTFAPPWPLVISLHRPFYAPFLFSFPQSSLSFLWVLQICKEFPLLMFWLLTASPRPDQTVHSRPLPIGHGHTG